MYEPDSYRGIINCVGGGATVQDVKIEFHIHIGQGGSYEQSTTKVSELQEDNGKHQLLNDQQWCNSVFVSALRYLLERTTAGRAIPGGDEAIAKIKAAIDGV